MTNLIPGKLYKVTKDESFGYRVDATYTKNQILFVTITPSNGNDDGFVDLQENDVVMYIREVIYEPADSTYSLFLFKNKLFFQKVNKSTREYLPIGMID